MGRNPVGSSELFVVVVVFMSKEKIELEDEERQPCEVWTRVMGYFRPVEAFNIGKKQEYADRKCFSQKKAIEHITEAAE